MSDKYESFKIWKLPHPLLLHWVLNPGLCINEVFLGQRLPKVSLIDKNSDEPLTERTYVECPHCETVHNSKIWSGGNTFRHYAGLYCPNCEEKIPTLLNIFSIIILGATFPIWKPLQLIYGERFKAWELSRFDTSATEESSENAPNWFKMGLFFGLAMGVFFLIQNIIISGWSFQTFTISLAAALFCGLAFGIAMKFFLSKKGRQS